MKLMLVPVMALAAYVSAQPAHAMSRRDAGFAGSGAIIDIADAKAPYRHVNRRNDAGNDTGDSEVDRLNSLQLDENYKGPYYPPGSPPPPAVPTPSRDHR